MNARAVAALSAAVISVAACGTDRPPWTGVSAPSTSTVRPTTSGVPDLATDDCEAGRSILDTNVSARDAARGDASLVARNDAASLWLIGEGQAMVVDAAGEVEVMSIAAADPILSEMTGSGSPQLLLTFSLLDDGTWACFEASTQLPPGMTSIGG